MRCQTCGTEVRSGQKFCMECGTSLRGIADITGEVPLVRTDRALSDDAKDEVTRAIGGASGARAATADATTPTRRDPPERDWQHDPYATIQLPREVHAPDSDRTTVLDRRSEPTTAPVPALPPAPAPAWAGDGGTTGRIAPVEDQWELGPGADPARPGHPFRLRVMFVLAAVATGATAVGVLTDLVTVTPLAAGAPPELVGEWMVNDFGTNNALAGLIAAIVMMLGALGWCFGFRWAAGLAGGAGTALAGWAALMVGLAEFPLFQADAAAATVPTEISRDIGYWALVAAGVLGLIVLVCSLAGSGRDRGGGLDPWIAALGAASFVVAAGGPLIPLNNPRDVSVNYSSDGLAVDLPTMFFAGRLIQLGLLALFGIVGFLLVRRYGLGLAIGAAVAAGWMVVTAATEQTDNPIGPAVANLGGAAGADMRPHGVTIVGMALVGFFALVAVGMALLDTNRKV